MHRTILVAATPDDAGHAAFALAIALARPVGANVILGGVVQMHDDVPPQGDDGLDAVLARLEPLRDEAPSDVPVSIDGVYATSVVHGLHELAVANEAQLLVLGPTHRGTISRALHRDTAADTVFTAPCGVAVASAAPRAAGLRRIGVAWDGTPEADEALEWAVQLAERAAATVHIVRVDDPRHAEGQAATPGSADLLATVRQAVEARAPASAALLRGDPGPALARVSDDVDLLILGSRARGPLRRVLFGSVSHDVLHTANCPVVVLPRGVHAPIDTAAV